MRIGRANISLPLDSPLAGGGGGGGGVTFFTGGGISRGAGSRTTGMSAGRGEGAGAGAGGGGGDGLGGGAAGVLFIALRKVKSSKSSFVNGLLICRYAH